MVLDLEDLEAMVDSEDGINEKVTHNPFDVILHILFSYAKSNGL